MLLIISGFYCTVLRDCPASQLIILPQKAQVGHNVVVAQDDAGHQELPLPEGLQAGEGQGGAGGR